MANYFSKTNGSSKNGDNSDALVTKEDPPFFTINEELFSQSPSDGNNRRFNRNPYQINSDEWNLGWTDGRYGQPKMTHIDIIDAEAELQAENELKKLQKEIAENKADQISLNQKIKNLEPKLVNRIVQHDKIYNRRVSNRQEYSIKLAWIYIIFSISLFLADIPLTIKLVGSGFGLSPAGNEKVTVETFSYVATFLQFILDYIWIFLLALGLMMLGVFVKIFFDKVILCEPEESSENPWTKWRTIVTLSIVLMMYIITFIYLGIYRENQLEVLEKAKIIAQVDMDAIASKEYGIPISEAEKIKMVEDRASKMNKASIYAARVFTLLTILLPLVGGLCFSIGSRKYFNAKLYAETKMAAESTQEEFDLAISEKERLENIIQEKIDELEKKKNSNADKNKSAKIRKSIYQHGYERGSKMMQTLNEGESLYERCETLISTKLAEKSRNSIWRTIEGEKS